MPVRPLVALLLLAAPAAADPLPNTQPLTDTRDLARVMVDGMHKFLDRELADAPRKRDGLKPDRERVRKVLGVVDSREPPRLEFVTPDSPRAYEGEQPRRVRWAVLPGLWAEGVYFKSSAPRVNARVILLDPTAYSLYQGKSPTAIWLARDGCDVLVPLLLDRDDTLSANSALKRATNQPHREFVHRMAFEMGRTLVGYEVQMALAAVDSFKTPPKLPFPIEGIKVSTETPPVGVWGVGDGGRVALYAAALDDRIAACFVADAFEPQETSWRQPLDRNLFGSLTTFGDAELAGLIAPRKLVVGDSWGTKWAGPIARLGRTGAAPGTLTPVAPIDRDREIARVMPGSAVTTAEPKREKLEFLSALGIKRELTADDEVGVMRIGGPPFAYDTDAPHHTGRKRQFDQLVAHVQRLWRTSDHTRREFWNKADASSPAAWEKSCDWYRAYFHEEVIGKLPEPTVPLNPRTRRVYDEPTFSGYEVVLDVYPDVIAQGILLLPKDQKSGERRPVVVCQHGLEGRPRSCIDPEPRPTYNQFARKLAEAGYVVYCPQNPYIFGNDFRQLQRKANPLKLSLFSFVVRQHQRTLDWLEALPQVDPKRIAFYGLSYGGKTAMRVPAIENRYCLSICSGDFNEWIGKNVSIDLDRSYMWTGEYEMYEFDLGTKFNYAEMAHLIAPRPFMVERGHDDPVGTDEMVASEYAKVRYLYANKLKLPDRTAIEFFPGGHVIHGKGTFEFLKRHLGGPR